LQLGSLPTVYGLNITATTTALATVRRVLQGAEEDLGIGNSAGSTLVDADGNALIFDRSVQVTHQIVAINLIFCSVVLSSKKPSLLKRGLVDDRGSLVDVNSSINFVSFVLTLPSVETSVGKSLVIRLTFRSSEAVLIAKTAL
jgi:hypothetical protein